MEEEIKKINDFIKSNAWCDFNIISLQGNLKIGGKTGFKEKFDIVIVFEDVFFIQCLYNWQTDTNQDSFIIPDVEEQRAINIKYSIEQGNILFKIIPEDVKECIYVSAKNVYIESLANDSRVQ
jgi:hypothetical protein